MKAVIVSWESEGKELYNIIRNSFEVKYVIEREHELWGEAKGYSDIQIISFAKAQKLYEYGEIDKYIIPCLKGFNVYTGIYLQLLNSGVSDDDILYAPLVFYKDSSLSYEERAGKICLFRKRTDLDYLVLHIVEHCNLSCANCSMFCGLVSHPAFMDFEKTKKALWKLKGMFDQILVFRLIGGEPFLNNEIGEYCKFIRSIYPLADLEIVTNGTLVRHMPESLIEVLQSNNVTLDITHYSVINSIVDELNEFLNKKEIKHYFTREIKVFSRLYDLMGRTDREEVFKTCKMKFNCVNMKENNIAVCHVPFALPRAVNQFDIKIVESGMIDLFKEGLSAETIRSRMNKPLEICRFCNRDIDSWHQLDNFQKRNIKNWSI